MIPGTVTAAYVHSDQVAHSWHESMMGMLGHDLTHEGLIARGGYITTQCGPAGIAAARNDAVAQFLDGGTGEWLLWLDTDMGFPGDLPGQLLAAADPARRPVMGALCFTQQQAVPDGLGGWRCTPIPTIFDWTTPGDPWAGFAVRRDYAPDAVTRCAGTGAACVLIHRSVFEKVAAEYGPAWYDLVTAPDGTLMGEDLSFCARAGALGIPVHVHTGIRASHMKRVWLAEDDYQRERVNHG